MKASLAVVLLFFLFSAMESAAQKVVVFDRMGVKLKRTYYYEGDQMALKVRNDDVIYRGEVHSIQDSVFFLGANPIVVDSIVAIVKYSKGAKALSITSLTTAAITGTFEIINNAYNKGELVPEENGYAVPAFFTALGVALIPFWKRKHKIGKNKVVKTLDLNPK
jgi:hypothetical protein